MYKKGTDLSLRLDTVSQGSTFRKKPWGQLVSKVSDLVTSSSILVAKKTLEWRKIMKNQFATFLSKVTRKMAKQHSLLQSLHVAAFDPYFSQTGAKESKHIFARVFRGEWALCAIRSYGTE